VLSSIQKSVIELISADNLITIDALAATIGVSKSAIEKNIRKLKEAGLLERKNGDRCGYWEIVIKL
jgi:predicted transcriptional regulator